MQVDLGIILWLILCVCETLAWERDVKEVLAGPRFHAPARLEIL